MKITLTIPDRFDHVTEHLSEQDVALILRDAFYEFQYRGNGPKSGRHNAQAYVDWRYPEREFSDSFRSSKVKNVQIRNRIAEALHASTIEIERDDNAAV
jgi:hypothetical protein